MLDGANELLSKKSAEADDLRLRCFDLVAKVATAWAQAAPLVERIWELEEELTRVATEQDNFKA